MSEELTAEERAFLDQCVAIGPPLSMARLGELYYAALARAEAAEQNARVSASESERWAGLTQAAESALAEATALLEECMAEDLRNPVYHNVRTFLSRTPAPAATAEPDLISAARAEVGDYLRQCESKAAELGTRLEMQITNTGACLQRALVAEARIAGLERELAAAREEIEDHLTELVFRGSLIDRMVPENDDLRAAIDAAVVRAESGYLQCCIDLLRAAQKAAT